MNFLNIIPTINSENKSIVNNTQLTLNQNGLP
mgnify:CR=1 FL=1